MRAARTEGRRSCSPRLRLAFASTPPGTSANAAIFDGQIVATQSQAVSVTLIGIPYAKYDVHVYFGHGPSWVGKSASVSFGSATRIFRNEDLTKYRDPISFRAVTTTSAPGASGNCASLRGASGSDALALVELRQWQEAGWLAFRWSRWAVAIPIATGSTMPGSGAGSATLRTGSEG